MGETDVVVVGAGAGGLAAAWRLTAAGARVVLLEAGREYRPDEDYPHDEDDFELHRFPYDAVRDEEGRRRYGFGEAQPIGPEWDAYRSWNAGQGRFAPGNRRRYQEYAHVRGVGGSTLRFQGEAHCFHPDSLRMASLFGAGADWPITHDELMAYYAIAARRIGVAAAPGPFRPVPRAPLLPPHPLSYASRLLAGGFASVGATLVPNSLAILSRSFDGRPECNYCNWCSEGCPLGDKGSADVTFLPPALATGRLDLRTGAEALEIEIGSDGRARAVVYGDRNGGFHRVHARAVLVAAGAVETPRLLLLSRSSLFPAGLANDHGQVGRHFTETLFWNSTGLLPQPAASFRGLPIDATAWEHAVPHRGDGWVGGFRLAVAQGAVGLLGPAAYAERLVGGFGPGHLRRLADIFGRAVSVLAVGEWLPDRRTRVDLDPRLKDRWGRPVARITSWLGANERALIRSMGDTARAILAAAGAGDLVEEVSALDLFDATHTLGTCQMGVDPRSSVADPDGCSHEVPNLAFADGSLLPSSGCGDSPFFTITAMAIRTADRLLRRLDRV